ncbi:hypothetical protein I553_8617 [Mycobacterium xenopi 4042]|uniref:Uncharacterized protein n=1 Tax=Mycobacterium xenopi 4042 TaxID=1299334 RepID=X8CKC4_MYCXE|nr:hypothetical protein I553_8617 [Mycobacterium xenopi 4042]
MRVLSAAVQEHHPRRASPQRSALIAPASTRSTLGSGPSTPACSAFSASSANSESPASSSSESTAVSLPRKCNQRHVSRVGPSLVALSRASP